MSVVLGHTEQLRPQKVTMVARDRTKIDDEWEYAHLGITNPIVSMESE